MTIVNIANYDQLVALYVYKLTRALSYIMTSTDLNVSVLNQGGTDVRLHFLTSNLLDTSPRLLEKKSPQPLKRKVYTCCHTLKSNCRRHSIPVEKQDYKMADATAADETASETITLRVKDQAGDEMFFKVKKNTKMQVTNWCLLNIPFGADHKTYRNVHMKLNV